jgi:hypothetical protein
MKETPLSSQSIVDRADFSATSIIEGVQSVISPEARSHRVIIVKRGVLGLTFGSERQVVADDQPIPDGALVYEQYEVGDYVGSVSGGARHTHDHPDAYISGIPVKIDARPETFIK